MRILIVDDNEADRNVIAIILREIDQSIDLQAVRGLAMARKEIIAKKFDLIFLDVRMNGGAEDGLLFLDEIRRSERDPLKKQRAVIISGMTTTLDLMTGVALNAEGVLDKDLPLSELKKNIEKIINKVKEDTKNERVEISNPTV